MKFRNVSSGSLKGSLKFKDALQNFLVPDIGFISSLDINTFNSFSLTQSFSGNSSNFFVHIPWHQ